MSEQSADRPAGVMRVVFKEIVEGDLRKFAAQSNDADTGGGARDLRFSPYDEFIKVFRKIFPHTRREKRRRNGEMIDVEIMVGSFHWTGGNKEATFEPPTDARPYEGRVPIVHTYPPFNRRPPAGEGRIVLLLIQRNDGTVWPEFATELSLGSGRWHDGVAQPILHSLCAKRPSNQVARGYIDFVSEETYSDA